MGRPPKELTPLHSELHLFGAELRHWRTLRELSQAKLGRRIHHSDDLVSKIEKGERFPSLAFARAVDRVLDTGGVLEGFWPRLERERASRPAPTPPERGEPIPADLGLVWSPTVAATVEVVGTLWRADMERRAVLVSAAWVASAFASPLREWLLDRTDEVLQDRPGHRVVSQHDINALHAMCEAFTDADARLGGGYARSTLIHHVNQAVLPLLHGSYSDAVGRELLAATARLCDLCGFMSADDGRQGLAQRYYIQALRLAQASGNRALGAHILADMSMQAHYFGNVNEALDLATAGYHAARDYGALSTAARCAAMQGETHALAGDQRACAQASLVAERMLDRAAPPGERTWTKLFTPDLMTAGQLYMADDLGRTSEVQRIAPLALASTGSMARRHVKCTTILAASYLPAENNPHGDVDHVCEVLGQALPALGSLHSAHTLERVNAVRRALAPYAHRPSVQNFESRFRTTVTAAAT